MLRSLHVLIVPLALLSLTACETPRLGASHHVIGSTLRPTDGVNTTCKDRHDELCTQARDNMKELAWYKENEWPYHRTNTRHPPQLCLAFSGGGIRAASFAIGVMKGLAAMPARSGGQVLDYVDIISGASGGAYAASWYYMNRRAGWADADLFVDGGTPQLLVRERAGFLDMWRYLGSGALDLGPGLIWNAAANGLLGTHTNTNRLGNFIYQGSLRDTFYDGRQATLPELRKFLNDHKGKVPFLIITTTSRVDENNSHYDSLLRNTVFEFTPLHIGNDGFTYINTDHELIKDMDIARIVAISGAALDSSQNVTGGTQRFFTSLANADTGQYILNYNDTRSELRRVLTKLAPFPFYFFTESYNHDRRGSDIYLSDGGHQENLATYPLVRRQCQTIIMVDAEYDKDYEFESYFKLKDTIGREMRVTMSLKPTTTLCANSPDGSQCVENNIDGIEKALRDAAESGTTRGEADQRRINVSRCCFNPKHPVSEGAIRYIPLLHGPNEELIWNEIQLLYVKLSLDTTQFEGWETLSDDQQDKVRQRVGTKAAEYYAATRRDTCSVQYWWNTCAFPQYSTFHQSFTPEQFEAYVDLGATMIQNHLTTTPLGSP